MNVELREFTSKNKDKQVTLSLNLKLDVKQDESIDDVEELNIPVTAKNRNCSSSRFSKHHDELLVTRFSQSENQVVPLRRAFTMTTVDWFRALKRDGFVKMLTPASQFVHRKPLNPLAISLVYPAGSSYIKKSFDFDQLNSKCLLAKTGIPSVNLRLNHYHLDETLEKRMELKHSSQTTVVRLEAYEAQADSTAQPGGQLKQRTLASVFLILEPTQKEKSIKFFDDEMNEIEVILSR